MQAPPASDDSNILPFAQDAAVRREQVVLDSENHTWNGLALTPWSELLESVYLRILAHDLPGHDLTMFTQLHQRYQQLQQSGEMERSVSFDQCLDLALYLPAAAKLLYLCAVPEAQWFTLRAKPAAFIRTIELWTLDHIPPQQHLEACLLAAQILTEHESLIAHRRVRGKGTADAGN